jgi:hypothetical protein
MERSGSLDLPWLGPCEGVAAVIGWNCYLYDFFLIPGYCGDSYTFCTL